jgi:hypothetical protein
LPPARPSNSGRPSRNPVSSSRWRPDAAGVDNGLGGLGDRGELSPWARPTRNAPGSGCSAQTGRTLCFPMRDRSSRSGAYDHAPRWPLCSPASVARPCPAAATYTSTISCERSSIVGRAGFVTGETTRLPAADAGQRAGADLPAGRGDDRAQRVPARRRAAEDQPAA